MKHKNDRHREVVTVPVFLPKNIAFPQNLWYSIFQRYQPNVKDVDLDLGGRNEEGNNSIG